MNCRPGGRLSPIAKFAWCGICRYHTHTFTRLHWSWQRAADVQTLSTGAGKAWLYVEPDGDVLRGQGYYQEVLGNMLTDSWEKIWGNAQQTKVSAKA